MWCILSLAGEEPKHLHLNNERRASPNIQVSCGLRVLIEHNVLLHVLLLLLSLHTHTDKAPVCYSDLLVKCKHRTRVTALFQLLQDCED